MRTKKRPFAVELLEERQMMFASVSLSLAGVLNIATDSNGDTVVVRDDTGPISVVSMEGSARQTSTFDRSTVRSIVFRGSDAADTFWNNVSITSAIYGHGGADHLYGGNGIDWIFGGNGNDVISGRRGNDRLDGGLGNDEILGGNGNDHLIGRDGNDRLNGGRGHDEIFGNAGDDYLIGGYGNDIMRGGDGDDRIAGGSDNDVMFGGRGNDVMWAYSGNDVLHGDEGDDSLAGEDGNDRLFGGAGVDTMRGGNGNDTLVSIDDDVRDILYGGAGTDSFWLDQERRLIFPFRDSVKDVSDFEADHNFHAVSLFANGADKTLNGDNIADPTDGQNYRNFSHLPLFASAGPTARDVQQGDLGDCWLPSGLGAAAKANANSIHQTVVDLGDGTYAVELGGRYYRVDGELPTWGDNNGTLRFAGLGDEQSIWVPIVEKAYTFYRRGTGTYASLNSGTPSAVFDAIGDRGAESRSFDKGTDALNYIATAMSLGKAVSVNIDEPSNGCPCIGSHSYIVERVNFQVLDFGIIRIRVPVSVVLRNPWGFDGAGNDGNEDGLVTVTARQLVASMFRDGGIQSAWVA